MAPDLPSDGLIAYKDGHLCAACEAVADRRTAITAESFTLHQGTT